MCTKGKRQKETDYTEERMQGGTARAPLALALAVDIEHGRGHRARLAGLLRDGTQNLGDGHHGVLIGLLFFSQLTGKPKAPKTEKKGAAVLFYRRSASVQATRLRHALGRAIQRVVIACPCAFAAPELRDRWVGAVSENTQKQKRRKAQSTPRARSPRVGFKAPSLPAPTGSAARGRAFPEVSPDSFVNHIPRLVLIERAIGMVDIKNMKHPRPAPG